MVDCKQTGFIRAKTEGNWALVGHGKHMKINFEPGSNGRRSKQGETVRCLPVQTSTAATSRTGLPSLAPYE